MNLLEAYNHTMSIVSDLEKSGIKVTKVPSRSRQNKDVVAKYATRLPVENWYHVTFYPETSEQLDKIYDARQSFMHLGICFDSGGTVGERDWEIDWSFKVVDVEDVDDLKGMNA